MILVLFSVFNLVGACVERVEGALTSHADVHAIALRVHDKGLRAGALFRQARLDAVERGQRAVVLDCGTGLLGWGEPTYRVGIDCGVEYLSALEPANVSLDTAERVTVHAAAFMAAIERDQAVAARLCEADPTQTALTAAGSVVAVLLYFWGLTCLIRCVWVRCCCGGRGSVGNLNTPVHAHAE